MTTAEPGRDRGDATEASTFTVLLATDGQPAAEATEQLVRRLADPQRVAVTVLGVSSFELALREGKRAEGRYSADVARRYTHEAVIAATAFDSVSTSVLHRAAPATLIAEAEGCTVPGRPRRS